MLNFRILKEDIIYLWQEHGWPIFMDINYLRSWKFRRPLFETNEWTYKELHRWHPDMYRLKVVARTSQVCLIQISKELSTRKSVCKSLILCKIKVSILRSWIANFQLAYNKSSIREEKREWERAKREASGIIINRKITQTEKMTCKRMSRNE